MKVRLVVKKIGGSHVLIVPSGPARAEHIGIGDTVAVEIKKVEE